MNLEKAIYERKELNEDYHVLFYKIMKLKLQDLNVTIHHIEKETLEEITKLTEISIDRCLRQEEEKIKKRR